MVPVVLVLKGERPLTPAMASTVVRPPGFVECYVCGREFGSRSIEIHEPQCLQKWRARNAALPRSRRETTPSPPPDHPLHARDMSPAPAPARGPPAHTPTSDPDELSTSWSDARAAPARSRPRPASFTARRHPARPSTATLTSPKVLDASLRTAVDMSKMTRSMVDQLILSRNHPHPHQGSGFDYYSSDFTSSSSSSSPTSSLGSDSENESQRVRPSTMRLPRPSRNIAVPVITSSSTRPTKKTSSLRSFLPRSRRRHVEEVFMGPRNKVKIPEPCLTCGKEQNPERFHSHPLHMLKFKAKGEEREKGRGHGKMAVTRPTALRYKSRAPDDDKKPPPARRARGKRTQGKADEGGGSPKLPAKREKSKSVPLRTFIQNQKAAIDAKTHKDLHIQIFEAESSIPVRRPGKERPPERAKAEREPRGRAKSHAPPPPRAIGRIEEEGEGPRAGSARGAAPTLLCYICGREFGSQSITIHEPQCLEKWKRENSRLPRTQQRPLPQRPDAALTQDQRNQQAWESAQEQLVPCEWCGRTFFPERLVVHQRGCKPPPGAPPPAAKGGRPDTGSSLLNTSLGAARPTVVCYICGREFGSQSITIHEPQCLRKWHLENDALPPNLRRTEPAKPEVVYDDEGKVDREATDEAAWRSHLETLVACDRCGRTFFPDRLAPHQRACLRES